MLTPPGGKPGTSPRNAEMDMATTPSTVARSAHEVSDKIDKAKLLGRYHSKRKVEDDYSVSKKVLGSGFSGEVKMAVLKDTEKDGNQHERFAVKTLDMADASDQLWEKMKDELQVSASVDHPNIVRLIDIYEAETYFIIVMELLEGGALSNRMVAGKGWEEAEASRVSKQLLLAVAYLHSHGIVHRDLKPDNFVFQNKAGTVLKMIDFGFSKFREEGEGCVTRCGTPAYAAPEIFSGKGYGFGCDLWSLGVIVFSLLVGYLPTGQKDQRIKDHIKAASKSMSSSARDFTRVCMQRDPAERITACNALEHKFIVDLAVTRDSAAGYAQIDVIEVASALQSYGSTSKMHRFFLSAIAKATSDEKSDLLREQFLRLDVNHSGSISKSEMEKLFASAGVPKCDVQVALDAMVSSDGHDIEFSEFMAICMSASPDFSDDTLHKVFNNFDEKRKGCITKKKLQEVLGASFEADFVRDHTQGINFEDFCQMVRQPTRPLPKPLIGRCQKFKGCATETDASHSSSFLTGMKDKFSYHARYVVISGLKIRWWRKDGKTECEAAKREIDLVLNDCEAVVVKSHATRFLLRTKTGSWFGAGAADIPKGHVFLFDAADSDHHCAAWLATLNAHIKFAHKDDPGDGPKRGKESDKSSSDKSAKSTGKLESLDDFFSKPGHL